MSKKKEWRVLPDYDGRVTLEQEETGVVLSNSLSQEVLADLAKNPIAAGFMERTTVNDTADVKDKN
ncbi:hypothetical protein [Persicitalea jodogahamensis]|uniref:Uncharacterized protein n=1 Tax=Persicitalea jodogahamensis TaxID=402147 RepID=A0A8J3G8C8_9BACT|nr:hypothetical protein [Persicitalea jodogahamensis]GHB64026.1 hypothetical protein GCM10007390_17380 [Persicitalea jodogahamensis]